MADKRRLVELGMPPELAKEVASQIDGAESDSAPADVLDGQTDVAVTWTTADPSITPDGAVTIANGGTPTVLELQHFCVELNAKIDAIIAALDGA